VGVSRRRARLQAQEAVVLDFLDYGTPERRRAMCEEEVRLNRRLAPELYLGVRGVVPTGEGVELTAADDPRAFDFVVEMRRYDERHTLAGRLERGEVDREQVQAVGCQLARFHAAARPVADAGVPALTMERRFERNLHELLACVEQRGEIGRSSASSMLWPGGSARWARGAPSRTSRSTSQRPRSHQRRLRRTPARSEAV
jgi:aminoglycoside phosphotransferase family enzyme